MKSVMGVKIVLIILFLQMVRNDIVDIKNESSCVNDECTTVGIDVFHEILELTTDVMENDFSTEEEPEEKIKSEEEHMLKSEPKLKSSNDGLLDESHLVKLPHPAVLLVPNNTINKNITVTDPNISSLSKKENEGNEDQLVTEKPLIEPVHGSKTERPTIETTTVQLNTNITNNIKNETNTTKEIYHNLSKNQSEICTCDLKIKECDINCCCDLDCNANMKTVFTTCVDAVDKVSSQFCFNSRSIFKNNLETNTNYNGLLCIVRNNLHPHVQFNEEMVIDNVTEFNRMITRKKVFTYSPLHLDDPEIQKIPYRFGDYVFASSDNKTIIFGLPKQAINMQCISKQKIHYLTDYETQCLRSVPSNREACMTASDLGMEHYLRGIQLITSPALITPTNSSNTVCSNKICVSITPYTCPEDTDLSSCVKSLPRRLIWDNICKNIVASLEYHIYHNGTEGIKEVRAYFTLRTLQKESFLQKIKLKFLWMKTRSRVFKRSGNPGYIIGKPVMSGRKVYSSNETMLKKEGIELSYNPEDWLTVVGSKGGSCSPLVRRPIGFGENARYTCFVDLREYDYLKRKCVDLQDILFNLLLGDEYANVKLDNNLNKFVATFGNSDVNDTGDWVQVIIDVLPIVSSQVTFTSHSDFVVCKNIISDLFIDIAYSKVGSFDKPQNKILGVHMYFGSPKNFVYYINPNCSGCGSIQNVKLSTYVHFIDLTREPHAEFAETPGFEAKLPHDFFYPFFSKGCISCVNFFMIFLCVSSVFF